MLDGLGHGLGDVVEARTTLDEGLALREVPVAELVMLEANLLKQEGKPDEAEAAYRRALKLREDEQRQTAVENARKMNLPPPQ